MTKKEKKSTLDYSLPVKLYQFNSIQELSTQSSTTDFRHAFILFHSSSGQFAFHPLSTKYGRGGVIPK